MTPIGITPIWSSKPNWLTPRGSNHVVHQCCVTSIGSPKFGLPQVGYPNWDHSKLRMGGQKLWKICSHDTCIIPYSDLKTQFWTLSKISIDPPPSILTIQLINQSSFFFIAINFTFKLYSFYIQNILNLHTNYIHFTFKLYSFYIQIIFILHSKYIDFTYEFIRYII